MKIKKVHCFFEQSGTFKNEFIKLGVKAEDYDILNDFGQTDHVIDLFAEIEKAFDGKKSVFDTINPKSDLVMAFFPCVRFEDQIVLHFKGTMNTFKNYTDEEKCLYDIKLMQELAQLFILLNKLYVVCTRGGVRMIIENPNGVLHFLKRYWCIEPTFIDTDRRLNGDYYKKPTQYWFLNCTPEQNILFEALPDNRIGSNWKSGNGGNWKNTTAKNRTVARSLIHPDYANRFIRQYILEGGNE